MMRYLFPWCFLSSPSRRRPLPSALLVLSLVLALVAMPPMAVSQPAEPRPTLNTEPAAAVTLPDLRQLPAGPRRKDAFLQVLVPIVEAENSRLAARREWLMALAERDTPWTRAERERVTALCKEYALDCEPGKINALLLKRVAPVPLEMVAVQNPGGERRGWHVRTTTCLVCALAVAATSPSTVCRTPCAPISRT